MPTRDRGTEPRRDSSEPCEKSEYPGYGGNMAARLKLKGIDGRAPPLTWSLRFNRTQHRILYQALTCSRVTGMQIFHDCKSGGAWPFLVRGVTCLLNCDNGRDLRLLSRKQSIAAAQLAARLHDDAQQSDRCTALEGLLPRGARKREAITGQ